MSEGAAPDETAGDAGGEDAGASVDETHRGDADDPDDAYDDSPDGAYGDADDAYDDSPDGAYGDADGAYGDSPNALDEDADGPDEDAYGGALGAFPYAIRTSDSWGFRSYAAVAALVAIASALLFALALVDVIAATVAQSAAVAVSRGWILIVWLGVVVPTVAPVLAVARRHRRGLAVHPRYDLAMALSGYGFLLALYAGLLASAPPGLRGTPPALVAPAVGLLYALPRAAGPAIPLGAAALEWTVHRWLG